MKTICILLAVSFLFWGIIGVIGKVCYKKLEMSLIKDNQQEFDRIFSSFMRKISLSSTKVLFLALNYALSKDNNKKMDEIYDKINYIYVSKANKRKIYPVMFQYYLEKENKSKCKNLLTLMENILPEPQIQQMKMIYEINVEKSSNYINDMLKQSENVDGQEKGMLYYLIAKQYGNKKEKVKRKKYLEESFEYLKDTPFGQVITYEMNQ